MALGGGWARLFSLPVLAPARSSAALSSSATCWAVSGAGNKKKDPRKERRHGRVSKPRMKPTWSPFKPGEVNQTTEWSTVFQTARPFDPYLIPMPIRMGRSEVGSVAPSARGNLELMKIPNFFHLTPVAIAKHCEALKPLCTAWPERLPYLPLLIETRNYVFTGHSVQHSGARKVTLKVKLDDLSLTERSREKMIKIAGQYFDPDTKVITLIGKRCPTRKQNHDYVLYLLKVLYLESNRVEPWEEEPEQQEDTVTS